MITACTEYLEHFSPDYVFIPEDHHKFYLEEKDSQGAGKCYFSSASPCIVLKADSKGALVWSLKNRKRAEGAILTHNHSGYHLHILEMKGTVTLGCWSGVLKQFEGMLLAALASVRLLGVQDITSVTCYLAFKRDAIAVDQNANPVLMKSFVGMPNPVSGLQDWLAGALDLPYVGRSSIVKKMRDADNNADFGVIQA